ncbi:CobQ-like glutamine amidotransferase family enzyme [Bacilli bacterium PM5-3]|nr:CobQ-like glutamine amidotransferase family enzyme [Bacilli bacterium PM5-3]MDH6603763.1 CobQ-like glutamine amidotransferase family enzyme [Bacilli bacterium PM5-9]
MEYHIYHMFPKLLNLYGDHGNIITLSFFAKKLGLRPIVHEIDDVSQIDWNKIDFMLIGGGSDREQALVTSQLALIKDKLKEEIENGLPVLAVCGGYQFLGNYYQDSNGEKLEGLQILDFYTIAQNKERMLGNTIVETDQFDEVIGFVNHAGETFHELMPLGVVSYGYGNNLTSKNEGVVYKNLIGTYLHGPLLPRNPKITLFFLELFMKKNNYEYNLDCLDLSMEENARLEHIARITNK